MGTTGSRQAFTLLEMLVVISVIAVLAGVVLPVFSSVQESGRIVQCVNNLRQTVSALHLYAQDHVNRLPQRYYGSNAAGQKIGYCEVLLPYVDPGHTPAGSDTAKKLFVCPSQKTKNYPADPGYGMNYFYDNASFAVVPSLVQTILLAETAGPAGLGSRNADRDNGPNGRLDDTRHRGKSNYAFFDGHVEMLTYAQTLRPLNGTTTDRWGDDAGIHGLPMPASPY